MKIRNILYAEDGMLLTDGTNYGKVIYLAVGADAAAYREISEAEYAAAMAESGDETV